MRWLRRLMWSAGALVLLGVVAWLAVPPLLQWQGQERLSALLGRSVTIGKVEFSPWNLHLALADIAVAAAPGAASAEPQLQIGAIRAAIDARSLLHLAPVVASLQIEAPRGRLTRTAAGHYDIDDVLHRLAPAPGAAPGEVQRFALYNVELRNGAFVFDDQPAGREHRLDGLQLALPFVSNLAADVEVKVEPRLAFTLNGAAFDSDVQALPFAPQRSGTLSLNVADFDLAPYLGYQPAALPVRVTHGRLSADLRVDFAAPAQAAPRVSVHGTVGGAGLAVTAADGAPLVEIGKLSLALKDVQPLVRKAQFGALDVDALVAHVARDAHGVLSVARVFDAEAAAPAGFAPAGATPAGTMPAGATPAGTPPAGTPPASPASASAVPASAASAAQAAPAAPGSGWQFGVESIALSNARIEFNDSAVQPSSAFVLADVAVKAQHVQLPAQAPAPFSLDAVLRPLDKPDATLASVALDGEASASSARVNVKLTKVSLAALAPYLSLARDARIAGTGALQATLAWSAPSDGKPQQIVAKIAELGLEQVRAGVAPAEGGKGEIVAVARARLSGAEVDLGTAKVDVAAVEIERPQVDLARSAQGAWNVMALAGATPLAQDPRAPARAVASLPWQVALHDVRVDGGRLRLVDAVPAQARPGEDDPPVRLDLDRVRLAVQDVRLDGARLVSQPRVALSAKVGTPDDGDRTAQGSLEWRGSFGLAPPMASGSVRVDRFPLHAVQDYAPHELGLRLERALASFDGDVAVRQPGGAGFDVDAGGEVRLADVKLKSVALTTDERESATDRELLSWRSFDLKRVKVALRPDSEPKLAIGAATLTDFFVRLVLTEDGYFNLRDVTARPQGAAPTAQSAAQQAAQQAAAPASAARPASAGRLPIDLDLGGVELVNGRIDYSDRFVKPNYSAALTELHGRIGAFRSASGEPATLQLAGRVAGTGDLEVAGRLNPGAVPRDLDITAKAHGIELAPLSPYARKYAGYPIERGKLSLDVHYKVSNDDRLQADHQLVLNQLTFGERVESPDATKLPVLLAVSLLKDANGVIDIDLPVSGTVSDPQFSLGGIILKVIVNLLTKAITAPFTLLAGGGGHDMSIVEFSPGTSVPTPAGAQTIDKVAKALAGRPALKLTITGEADPVAEHGALLHAMLEQRLVQERQREAPSASGKASEPAAAAAISGDERTRLLKALYKETDIPGKPRNLIGMQSDIPPEQMETMLLGQLHVGPEAMRELALQRGLAVRDALAAQGLATERLFLGAPRLHADAGSGAERGAPAVPRNEAGSVTAGAAGSGASATGSADAKSGGAVAAGSADAKSSDAAAAGSADAKSGGAVAGSAGDAKGGSVSADNAGGGAWTPRAKLDLGTK